jgi:aryl-alcohol dehydrogenase-like predicted oxidoreductase
MADVRPDAAIERRHLGSTGIEVSLLGFGTVKLGRSTGVKYPHQFSIPDDNTVSKLLSQIHTHGINLIDTAPAYGTSETRLGELLYRCAPRSQWVIATKTGEEYANDQATYDFTPEHTQKSVRRSLSRLQTDYLDLVLIHSNGDDVEILKRMGTLDALRQLKDKGMIRAIGMSHKSVDGGMLAIEQGAEVVMTELRPDDVSQMPVVAAAHEKGCGVMIKKALASGRGKSSDLAEIAAIAGVSSIVVGTITPAHLADNIQAIARP